MARTQRPARRSRTPIVGKEGHVVDASPPECDETGMGEKCHSQGEYSFVLVNPNDFDSDSKSHLQAVLLLYKRELPAMVYAANTGKQSTFMEKCVSNGKYCTLLLKSTSETDSGTIIAAITYQIVPADTQYAEIPLAAVSSAYQHKGFCRILYMELRKRLQSVGIRTIFCWGDKESEGFWSKQGFLSIAEVDTKGKARRIPVRADIRRALCFPGGSTLMVSHIYQGSSTCSADRPKSCTLLKPDVPTSYEFAKRTSVASQGCKVSNAIDQQTIENLTFQPEEFASLVHLGGENKIHDSQNQDVVPDCNGPVSFAEVENSKTASIAELTKNIGNLDEIQCSCSTQRAKRGWEASLSSLKSKKVKGVHLQHSHPDSNRSFVPESNGSDTCSQACSLANSKHEILASLPPKNLSTSKYTQNFCEEFGSVKVASEDLVCKGLHTRGKSFRIMLMNIADEAKKTQLVKVIEELGGSLTSDGSTSTHVITGKVRKTLNFCTALCSGAWIVSPSWLKESYREGRFVDEFPYVLNDDDYTSKYRASLKTAVLRAKARPGALFEGYDVCISSHAQPPPKTLSVIVKSAGGNVINGLGKVSRVSETIFVACEEDVEEALMAIKEGIWTFNSEWLMSCVMRQELDMEAPQFAESL
ncbi:uncharacterized protein LOC111432350 isoform X1 [Cucurbita moschata]|uniref:Uncharacterized protein LOC111432350 isoform X1 n=1 Tax=Cucurbita moschata TaxID=3662 RepID=A0A6J1EGI9_CUCMO|nr:uncharacterized protein LOC111432350 isoform X1 [Cucurbita moschata]